MVRVPEIIQGVSDISSSCEIVIWGSLNKLCQGQG